jgi:hypothetical protein
MEGPERHPSEIENPRMIPLKVALVQNRLHLKGNRIIPLMEELRTGLTSSL